jgi:VWFA-related protein
MKVQKRYLFFIVALLAGILLPLTVVAQGATQVLINYPELAEEGDGLGLGLYFNITDTTGHVVTNAEVQSARILLDDGTGYDATVEKPTSPIYIALVLDASGSMAGAAQAMRQAAIDAVNSAPEEALFAVIRFNASIDQLTDFTADRNQAINAIGEVQPINLSGTCLYDATFRAIELLGQSPPGRRAIILFTDGKDETAQGTPCSQHVFSDVVSLASQPTSRVPIHAIGLSGGNSAINAAELRDLASSTGGLAAIGDQSTLGSLFGQIMDALKAQWLAHAVVYPTQGNHTAQLLVTLSDGSFPQPALAVFVAGRNYFVAPTITPTAPTSTPTIVSIAVDSVSFDPTAETISVKTIVQNEQLVNEYRFQFKNENNLLQAEFVVPAPLPDIVTFPSRTLQNGEATLDISGVNSDGDIVARSAPFEFTYQGPTPTSEPPTATPEAVSATLTGIQYDEGSDKITLNLSLLGQAQINTLQVYVINGDTNLLEQTYPVAPATTVDLPTTGLKPGQSYNVNVIAQGQNGQILSQSNQEFTYTPLLTPTPTPIAVDIAIQGIDVNDAAQEFVIQVQAQNEEVIEHYRLRVVNTDSGLLVGNFEFEVPEDNTLHVPLTGISSGQYEMTLDALDAQNTVLDTFTVQAKYTPPTPTPSPTPLGGIQAFIASARSNPIIIVVIAAIAVSLLLLLFILLRQPKKQTGTGFLQELTSVQQVPSAAAPKRAEAPRASSSSDPDKTNAVPFYHAEEDATNVVPATRLPNAVITVSKTRDASRTGQTTQITHIPFTMGRRGRDLNFEGDDNVSRNHAIITYTDGTFYITDEGSTHGTAINGARVPPRTPVTLPTGARIMLGTTTMLTFDTESDHVTTSGFDPDRTNV